LGGYHERVGLDVRHVKMSLEADRARDREKSVRGPVGAL